MQQTETYKLNLIESSDPFLPNALNENTQKIEEVVSGSLGDMDERIKVFEAKKFVCGTCTASMEVTVELGFTPVAVAVHQVQGGLTGVNGLAVTGQGNQGGLEIVEGGFHINSRYGMSSYSGLYTYIAFG